MRLIDADATWKLVRGYRDTKPEESVKRKFVCNTILLALMDEKETPTIDAVPVVRCKDCMHWNRDGNGYGDDESHCTNPNGLDNYARPDDFCSYGERKDGEG